MQLLQYKQQPFTGWQFSLVVMRWSRLVPGWVNYFGIIIIIIKNECHSNIIVDRLQGCGHSKKLQESESESRSSKVV